MVGYGHDGVIIVVADGFVATKQTRDVILTSLLRQNDVVLT